MSSPSYAVILPFCLSAISLHAASETERVRNERVTVVQHELSPGDIVSMESRPTVTVYLDDGSVSQGNASASKPLKVQRGQAAFLPAGPVTIRNTGQTAMRLVRVEFRGAGSRNTWGRTGLAPNYRVLLENDFARVYDIRIPAGGNEPTHTHHDRVVICLSGALLKHVLPDGKDETATLNTGEVAFRAGATHSGHNVGQTDFWAIAVEPK